MNEVNGRKPTAQPARRLVSNEVSPGFTAETAPQLFATPGLTFVREGDARVSESSGCALGGRTANPVATYGSEHERGLLSLKSASPKSDHRAP